jgi:hypothetical protein
LAIIALIRQTHYQSTPYPASNNPRILEEVVAATTNSSVKDANNNLVLYFIGNYVIKHAQKIHETCSDVDYRRVDSKNYTARHLQLSNMYKPGRNHIKDWIRNRDQTDMTYYMLANIPVYGKYFF